ncbi:unnamed protein product [marine sediment metagenome]|uniref:Polysaccharide biosynthesis protein CapD-like domain-containing protein n=1 Tax=marine sediment metagenome TaxID=412755 RepID=X1USU8_9ZZZZ
MQGGEIFIPKIPSMKIIDLAKAVAPKAKIKVTGIRPGEKIHETLLTGEEVRHAKEFDNYFVIEPEYAFWDKNYLRGGESPLPGFIYSSDNNDQWLTKTGLSKILEESK